MFIDDMTSLLLVGFTIYYSVFAILGFMYSGINFNFFSNPHKLEVKRVVIGIAISVMGIVLAVVLFL